MTIYAGETVLLSHTASFDGEVLDDANTESVSIFIYDPDFDPVVDDIPMVWDEEHERWEYWWSTVNAGRFRIKVRIETILGVSWEYFKVTVKADVVPED